MEDNFLSPAYPSSLLLDEKQNTYVSSMDISGCAGFTKLELAALMIAKGIVGRDFQDTFHNDDHCSIAIRAVQIAKAVLEEANK